MTLSVFTIPTLEPLTLVIGDSFTWTRDLTYWNIFPADGWTLSYNFVPISSIGKIEIITATDNGDGTFLIAVVPATTAAYIANTYCWGAIVTSSTGERHTLFTGSTEFLPNYQSTNQYNFQSGVKNVLDALELMIAGKLAVDQQNISVAGRSLSKMTVAEVLDAYNYYKELYTSELRQTNNAQKRPGPSKILVRMGKSTDFTFPFNTGGG